MNKLLLHFLKGFIPFSLLIIAIHYFVIYNLEYTNFHYSLPAIYFFHILATLIIYVALVLVYEKAREYTGYTFIGAGLLKMMAAVLFLLPMITGNTEKPFLDILSFFIPYFLYLIFETIYAVKLINR
jgi:hypothetical protein